MFINLHFVFEKSRLKKIYLNVSKYFYTKLYNFSHRHSNFIKKKNIQLQRTLDFTENWKKNVRGVF